MGFRAALRFGDGTIGWDEYSPYDKIIVTAGAPVVPANLKNQLKIGGVLVIPVGDRQSQIMKIITKISEEELKYREVPYFAFVPLIGRDGWKNGQ